MERWGLRAVAARAAATSVIARVAIAACPARVSIVSFAALMLPVLAAGPALGQGAAEPPVRPRSVLLVTLDTTRADHLGCYNARHEGLTPNFDALARAGVQFTRCYSASAITPPAHASILTGLYPHQHGLRVIYARSGRSLDAQVTYLPAVLRGAGLTTAAFLSAFTVSEFYLFDRGFDTFDAGLESPAADLIRGRPGRIYDWPLARGQRRSDATTDSALAWLARLDPREDFFLWVHYWDPHDGSLDIAATVPPADFLAPFLAGAGTDETARQRAIYAADVGYMDQQFGRLWSRLVESGRDQETMIVVVADHGEGLGEHGWWTHSLLYEEQLHVPLILRVPGWPGGRTVTSLARTVDILPTILECLGLAVPEGLAGRSLGPTIRTGGAGVTDESPRAACAEALNGYDQNSHVPLRRPQDSHLYCATDGVWKLIWHYDHSPASELYNLSSDPDEERNLYAPDHAEALRLRGILEGLNPFRTTPFDEAPPSLDEAARRALESLGYIRESGVDPPEQPSE